MNISEVETFVVANPPPRQGGRYFIFVKLKTDSGVAGIGEAYDATLDPHLVARMIEAVAGRFLIGESPFNIETFWRRAYGSGYALRPDPTLCGVISALEMACWDLIGKECGRPVYDLLGCQIHEGLRSYTYLYPPDGDDTYLPTTERHIYNDPSLAAEAAQAALDKGFTAVKFHCWCLPEKDLELCRAALEQFPGTAFMHDVENNYSHEDALRVGKELAELNFTWFEAPFPDWDLDGYRQLTSQVDVPIIPSGNWLMDLQSFGHAVHSGTWTRARTDITCLGGLTPAWEALQLCESAGIGCEVLGWGNTLISAANLHLMLANDCCSYFEQSVPYEPYEYGMLDVIRTDSDGQVTAPDSPGLGVRIDWDAMEAATVHRLVFD